MLKNKQKIIIFRSFRPQLLRNLKQRQRFAISTKPTTKKTTLTTKPILNQGQRSFQQHQGLE